MASTSYISADTATIPGNGKVTVQGSGNRFTILSCTVPFQWSNGKSGGFVPANVGDVFQLNGSDQYGSVVLFNPTAAPITVSFYFGTIIVINAGLSELIQGLVISSQKDFPTVPVGTGVKALANNATDTYNGVSAGLGKRRVIVFTNLDAANNLIIQDGNGNAFCPMPAMSNGTTPIPIEFWSSGTFKVKNTSGAPVNYEVGEIYYTS
jgi:hypothetical protein